MLRVTVELPAGYASEAQEGKKDISHQIWKDLRDLYEKNGEETPNVVCRFLNESPDSSNVRACNADVMIALQCVEGEISAPGLRLKIADCLKGAVCAKTSVPKEKITVFLTEIPANRFSIDGILVCDSK